MIRSESEIKGKLRELEPMLRCKCGRQGEMDWDGELTCPGFKSECEQLGLDQAIALKHHDKPDGSWYELGAYHALRWVLGELEWLPESDN